MVRYVPNYYLKRYTVLGLIIPSKNNDYRRRTAGMLPAETFNPTNYSKLQLPADAMTGLVLESIIKTDTSN